MVDIKDSGKKIEIAAELPGLDPEDIDINVSDNILMLRGQKKQESETKDENYFRRERIYGSFRREIILPAEVESDNIDAVFKNGNAFDP